MVSIELNVQEIPGNWRKGWTLDQHTVSSRPLPGGGFDTVRTDLGELLYQLKYCSDRSKVGPIARTVSSFVKERLLVYPYLAAIVPVPPSKTDRPLQPVIEVASEVGRILDLPAPPDYLIRVRETAPLKSLDDPDSRREELQGAMAVQDKRFKGKYVLLFDDIYRSGETLAAATDFLCNAGGVSRVFVLALTRTRTKR